MATATWDEVSGKHGKIIAHVGGKLRQREELRLIRTPDATKTWKPVPHFDLVSEIIANLEAKGITIGRDAYVTQGPNDVQLLGFMDLEVPGLNRPDFGFGLGISAANDKSKAIRVVAAARVFICDNRAFSGDKGAVFLRKKHTSGLDLSAVVPPAIDLFLEKSEAFAGMVDRMKEMEIGDTEAKALICDAFSTGVVQNRLLKQVCQTYFDSEEQREKFPERTLWSLNNAFTEVTKELGKRPGVQFTTESRVGRFFGKIAMRGLPKSQVLLPAGTAEVDSYAIRNDANDGPDPVGADGDLPGQQMLPFGNN